MTTRTLPINKLKVALLPRALASAGAFAVVAAVVFVRQINPTEATFLPQCPLHALTGLNCPGCGATRGMHALLNGDFLGALDYNVLLVAYLPLMIYGFLTLLSFAARGRGLPFPRFLQNALFGLLVVMLVFGILRNLPFYPFTILAP